MQIYLIHVIKIVRTRTLLHRIQIYLIHVIKMVKTRTFTEMKTGITPEKLCNAFARKYSSDFGRDDRHTESKIHVQTRASRNNRGPIQGPP